MSAKFQIYDQVFYDEVTTSKTRGSNPTMKIFVTAKRQVVKSVSEYEFAHEELRLISSW